jgi:hypothetical protein
MQTGVILGKANAELSEITEELTHGPIEPGSEKLASVSSGGADGAAAPASA